MNENNAKDKIDIREIEKDLANDIFDSSDCRDNNTIQNDKNAFRLPAPAIKILAKTPQFLRKKIFVPKNASKDLCVAIEKLCEASSEELQANVAILEWASERMKFISPNSPYFNLITWGVMQLMIASNIAISVKELKKIHEVN